MNQSKLYIRTDYPLFYWDRVHVINNPEEKKYFCENSLDYRNGLEYPKINIQWEEEILYFLFEINVLVNQL